MTDLKALRELVEKASGPDRDIDRAILDALGIEVKEFNPGDDDIAQWRVWSDGTRVKDTHITASIDAALALVEQVLPGWGYEIHSWPNLKNNFAHLGPDNPDNRTTFQGYAQTVPLAILAALLAALEDKPNA